MHHVWQVRVEPGMINRQGVTLQEKMCMSLADLEIVGQPVSLADRKYLTSQKVLMVSSLLQDIL